MLRERNVGWEMPRVKRLGQSARCTCHPPVVDCIIAGHCLRHETVMRRCS